MLNTSHLVWPSSADMLRDALHMSDKLPLRCCGTTQKHQCCKKPISNANRTSIQQLLSDAVAAGSWSAARELLVRLSQLVLCQGPHQKQGSGLLCSWQKTFAETEKPRAVGKPAVGSAHTSTVKVTIKPKPIGIRTHTTVAAGLEVTAKSEPDEEADLSLLLQTSDIHEKTQSAHVFVPYGKTRTQEQINKAIKGIIGKPLSSNEIEALSTSGVVYTYKFVQDAGHGKPHIKIGYTAYLERRKKEWKRSCGYDTKPLSHNTASLYMRVERLVHAQLWACRKREAQCPGCGRSHKEFFDVRLPEANRVIGLWAEWMEHRPYGDDGLLKTEWLEKLREVDLGDPDCWETFTAKE